MPGIIMRAGEQLTCENGHLIGLANCDIAAGWMTVDCFQWLIDPAPQLGDAIQKTVCPTCGADYIRLYNRVGPGYQPHTGGPGEAGWVDWRTRQR